MDRWDALCALGVALIGAGVGLLVAPWLALVVTGVLLLVTGLGGGVAVEWAQARKSLPRGRS